MILYISSYKLGNEVDELKKWVTENNKTIALIPNSRDVYPDDEAKKIGIEKDAQLLEEIGFEVKILDLRNYFNNNEKLREDIKNFHAFFSIGGNVFVLRQAMRLSGFDEYLKSLANQDSYLYGGYSAGICLLAPSLNGFELVDNSNANPYGCDPVFEGLGIIDFAPVPHFSSDHSESEAINDVIRYMKSNGIIHKPLRDGDVIITDTNSTMRKGIKKTSKD